jgi:diacylglycerol kinase (ATP)
MQANPHKVNSGVKRVLLATKYSYEGLFAGLRWESAFRQEAALAAVMLPLAFWLGGNWMEVAVLCITVVLVLIVELLNSAIEAAVDRVSFDRHELSKLAKDYGSAAVHLSLLLCLFVWLAAIWHRFFVA